MSDIVLIYPYVYKHARNSMLFHPLGIAQLSALLRQRGMDTTIIDLTFRNTDEALIKISEIQPKVVGIYVMLTMIDNAFDLARKIRVISPETLLVCGGPMPTLRPEQFDRDFNLIFRGESILSFPLFCKDFLDARDISDVLLHHDRYPGIYMRDMQTNKVIKTPAKATDEALINQLPIPDRTDFDHDSYQKFWLEKDSITQAGIMTTYGCPHNCDFCSKPVFGNIFRNANQAVYVNSGRDNIVENNIFVNYRPSVLVSDARESGSAKCYFDGSDNTLLDGLKAVKHREPPYSLRYPRLVNILEDDPAAPKGSAVRLNIVDGPDWLLLLNMTDASVLDIRDNIDLSKSGLVDPARSDFRFRDASPALEMGFVCLPVEDIGPRRIKFFPPSTSSRP